MPTNEEMLILKAATEGDLQLLKLVAAFDEEGFQEKCERARFEGLTALHIASGEGKTQICKYLIESVKMNINITTERGETPLLAAIMMDQLPTATYFIQHGADVNASDCDGAAPLHIAVKKGHKKLMQLLISRGADIEAIHDDCSPLQAAAAFRNKEAVRILLEHNANPNSAQLLSATPLMMSIIGHSIECLDMLLKAGANPNISAGGMTPLALATTEMETQYVKFLLRAGANPNVIDPTGMTLIEHAALAYHLAGVMILFPVTSRIPSIPDWSFNGIMSYVHSDEGEEQAYNLDPDAAVLSNRSLCWANMKNSKRALCDAEACIALKPDWPKAHYRQGVALMLLKNYSMASEAFSVALRLDPENKEIQKAFKEAVEAEFGMSVADDIRALHI